MTKPLLRHLFLTIFFLYLAQHDPVSFSQLPSDMNDSASSDDPSDQIRFGMLSNDDPSSTDRMEKYTGEVGWDYLRPHFESGALLYVDPSLSLVEVGQALVDDDSRKVADWRSAGDLVTPSAPHAEFWESSRTVFHALVISPFVLAQPVPDEETG